MLTRLRGTLTSVSVILILMGAGSAAWSQAPAQPASAGDAAGEARAAAAAFHAALEAGDRAAAIALLLPEVTIFESGQAELSRDEYAAHHLAADIEFVRATTEEVVASEAMAAGDVAVIMTRSRTNGTFREKPVDVDGVETLVLRHTAHGWRIAHVHWSSHRRPG
jgi:ketosteroid isomerase-like protein